MGKFVRLLFAGRRKFLISAFVFVILLGLFFWLRSRQSESLTTTKVVQEEIISSVSASGIIAGENTASLKFNSAGKLVSLRVSKGDKVKKGQAVASLDTIELSITLQQAKNTLRDKQAILDKIYDDIKGHEKDETLTQKQTRTTAEVAKDNAYDTVRTVEHSLKNSVITAPFSGIVVQADFVPGQFVSGSDVIVKIVSDSVIYFDAEVDESDIGKVKIGMKAKISLNSNSNLEYQGQVVNIIPQVKTSTSGASVVIVRINMDKAAVSFISGVNGQAEIIIDEKRGLALPYEVLVGENKLYKFVNGKPQRQEIKIGVEGDEKFQVLDGVLENDEIVTNPEVLK